MTVQLMLGAVARVYGAGVGARNFLLDHRAATKLPVPVISVGNITAGGTGKTPMVIEITQRLIRRGRRVAVISRGYHADPGTPNDEHRLIQRHCPQAICVSDPDRVRGATAAVRAEDSPALTTDGADVLVLDDAFQHRRLHRDLDIVLIDATCPFGFDHLLPRGLLREPLNQLKRADLIVITRADQVLPGDLAVIKERLWQHAADVLILECRHRAVSATTLWDLGLRIADLHPGPDLQSSIPNRQSSIASSQSNTTLEGKQVVCFAGIGNPEAFEATVAGMGATVVGRKWWPDHHHYHPRDIDDLLRPGRFPDFELLVTTEKDAVKLASLALSDRARIAVVAVEIEFLRDGGTILAARLDELLGLD